MADALNDDQIKDEIAPDTFEMMFLQTSEGKAPEAKTEEVKVDEVKTDEVKVEETKVEETKVDTQKAEEVKVESVKPVATEPAKAATPEPAKAAEPPPAPVIEYTEEELADLEAVKKDFPEITKVLVAQERLLTKRFEALLQTEVAKVQQNLAPVFATAAQTAQEKFEQAIASVHADAKALLPDAEAWIATQPKFLQAAYNQVLDNGTAAEVIEFFTTFKTATGRVGTPPPTGKSAEEVAAEAEKQRKLASQEGVKAVRTPSKKDTGPASFEEAFGTVR